MNLLQKLFLIKRMNKSFYKWDRKKIEKHQKKRLKYIINFVKENSKYYKNILGDTHQQDISLFPIINKKELMENFDIINTQNLKKEDLIDFRIKQEKDGSLGFYENSFSVGLSSGTSGNKSLTVLSRKETELYSCLLWSRNGIPKNIKNKRVLFCLRRNNPSFMEVSSLGVKLVYMDYTHPPQEYIKIINEKKLNIIAGPPSLLEILSYHVEEINHQIDALISYAEVLSSDIREKLETSFKTKVVQIYQGAEGFLASTCKNGNLHLHEDILFFEFEDLEDDIGESKNIILTDLYRETLPIIRYKLNDVMEVTSENCSCGSCFKIIKKIHGRMDDVFLLIGKDNQIKYLFPDYVRRSINQASDQIIEYQAIQHSENNIEIRISLEKNTNRKEIENKIQMNLEYWVNKIGAKLGNITFSNEKPEKNPDSKKLIRIIRRFK